MMMMEKTIRFLEKEKTIWGPVFLLCTLAFGAKSAIPFDLLFLAITGLYLSARWQLRGCCYALALLGISSAIKHAFFTTDHLWELGVEGSLACAYFITALSFEQGALFVESLSLQMQTRKAALDNLEEELSKVRETALSQQIAFQERIAMLQKELDDLQSDHSSLTILNEVLRKTTARHIQESETSALSVIDHERQIVLLKEELYETEKELCRLSSTEPLVIQNSQLMKELNAVRYEKEQTHLINETLARLYVSENLKAKEANQEAASFADQLAAAHREVQRIEQPLQEQLALCRNEIETLSAQFEKAVQEANQGRLALQKLSEIQAERNFLKERLQAALSELALHQNKLQVNPEVVAQLEEKLQAAHAEISLLKQQPKIDPHVEEQLAFAREKMLHLAEIEPLFLQLKKQFEEKNQVLHQTRSHLFMADTELQRLKIEKAAIELNPFPKEVEKELQELGHQVQFLEEENLQLQELVTLLSEKTDPQGEKKK